MQTSTLKINTDKSVQVIRLASGYRGIYFTEDRTLLHLTLEPFGTVLAAANAARKAAKEQKVVLNSRLAPGVSAKVGEITEKPAIRLYTEQEKVASKKLKFREVWTVLNTKGDYVKSCLEQDNKSLVTYTQDKDKAKLFKSYEEASMLINTFKAVYLGPHAARRFFIENE
jgi:hypothetical protein